MVSGCFFGVFVFWLLFNFFLGNLGLFVVFLFEFVLVLLLVCCLGGLVWLGAT